MGWVSKVFEPDSEQVIKTFQGCLITETLSVFLSVLMLGTFIYQCKKHKAEFSKPVVALTLVVIVIGTGFAFCQFIENWLIVNCGAVWLQLVSFFFYVAHRAVSFSLYLYRLYIVFAGTTYCYPMWLFYSMSALITVFFISSYAVYCTDYGVSYVDINWENGNSGTVMCSWAFGDVILSFSRPFEFGLNIILLLLFLWKLWELRRDLMKTEQKEVTRIERVASAASEDRVTVEVTQTGQTETVGTDFDSHPDADSGAESGAGHNQVASSPRSQSSNTGGGRRRTKVSKTLKMEVLHRKLSLLTSVAVISTFSVILGYTLWKPFAVFFSLDAVINSLCAFLMFKFNHKFIRPFFGVKCDRACCLKFTGCCACYFIGCGFAPPTESDDAHGKALELGRMTPKSSQNTSRKASTPGSKQDSTGSLHSENDL